MTKTTSRGRHSIGLSWGDTPGSRVAVVARVVVTVVVVVVVGCAWVLVRGMRRVVLVLLLVSPCGSVNVDVEEEEEEEEEEAAARSSEEGRVVRFILFRCRYCRPNNSSSSSCMHAKNGV